MIILEKVILHEKPKQAKKMNHNRNELNIETIEFDYTEENVQLVLLLERLFIYSLKPGWNCKQDCKNNNLLPF